MASKQAEESDSDDEPPQHQFKVVLLGDGAVGKTSLARRITKDSFTENYKQTIGLDFALARVMLDELSVALQIWDIGGQSIGSAMMSTYLVGSHAVLLVYDISSYDSFANLEDWLRLVRRAFQGKPMPKLFLLGNKSDLSYMRAVKSKMANQFSDENNLVSFYMSAKSGDQVEACFRAVAARLAGVEIRNQGLTGPKTIVTAQIVNHPQNDQAVNEGKLIDHRTQKSATRRGCCIS
jgi:Ras-related protein Rab-28